MKIKVTPEDFVVKEIVTLPIRGGRGQYRVYLLQKAGWNTVDAVRSVAAASGVDPHLVGYAGLKDRHALTSQHISVPAEFELESRRPEIRLTFLGFCDDFVSTRVLAGNSFDIRLRGLTREECDFVGARAAPVRDLGFPNYFDDQRFGSVTAEGDFMAERLVRRHLKGALKVHLSAVFPTQKKAERDRRERVASVWGKWDQVLAMCETEEDRAVAAPLTAGGGKKNLIAALNAVPKVALARYIAAYQAFIWNETLRRLIGGMDGSAKFREAPGKAGAYVFPSGKAARMLTGLEIPTASSRIPDCEPHVAEVMADILSERGVAERDFNIRGLRSGYFKSFFRKAAVIPEGFAVTPPARDRGNPDLKEVRVSFTLPAGSYATMLLKALSAGVE